jgi:hypothetical protein
MHIRDAAPHPRTLNPSIPDNLAAIVMRLLEKEPAARFQTALETRDALASVGASAPSRPPVMADQYAATIAPPSVQRNAMGTGAGGVMTTASGAAAQVMHATTQPPTGGGRTGVIVGVGVLVAALGGVGVYAAMRGGGDAKPAVTAASPGSAAAGAPAVPPVPPPPAAPAQPELTVASATPCPLGMVRGLDTKDHCCWPEQAWSSTKNQCVGTPVCPDGHEVQGDGCVVIVAANTKPVPASTRPPSPPPQGGNAPDPAQAPVPHFTVPKVIAPGAKFTITFSGPIAPAPGTRTWITIVEAAKPPTQYGNWTYIDEGATTVSLAAPSTPGAYEVRLHTDYPRLSTNVRQAVAVQVKDSQTAVTSGTPRNDQRFMLAATTAQAGEEIEITFPVAMKAVNGEKFWITVVQKGAGDSSYGTWSYVPDGARTMQFKMPTAVGDYEIRLHANYPRLSTNVVHRAPIRVED